MYTNIHIFTCFTIKIFLLKFCTKFGANLESRQVLIRLTISPLVANDLEVIELYSSNLKTSFWFSRANELIEFQKYYFCFGMNESGFEFRYIKKKTLKSIPPLLSFSRCGAPHWLVATLNIYNEDRLYRVIPKRYGSLTQALAYWVLIGLPFLSRIFKF